MDLDNLYQELIIDHGTEPHNFHALTTCSHDAEGFNPLCGDKVHVYVLLEDNKIKDISFLGKGCAISTASASIMTDAVKGKTLDEVNTLFKQFQGLLTTDQEQPQTIGKLIALSGVKKYPSRVKCATLAWHTLHEACNKSSRADHAK